MNFYLNLFAVFAVILVTVDGQQGQLPSTSRVVCYFDSASFKRDGMYKISLTDIEPALSFCTHLVYGYAGINADSNKIQSLNENDDLDQTKGHYRMVTKLKSRFPNLKILLSVGGNSDDQTKEKYLTILESSVSRMAFINSAYTLIKSYDFDGLDLAWEFPPVRPIKIRGTFSSIWNKIKTSVGVTKDPVDAKSEEHKGQFTSLVNELKNAFRPDGYQISLTVLPNVNSSLYFDMPAIINNLDFINLAAFDFQTPERNPKEADFPSPIYEPFERHPEANVNYQVTLWLGGGAPASKINLGIPTYARVWKMTEESGITGVPPLTTDGAGNLRSSGLGIISWPVVCANLPSPANLNSKGDEAPLKKVNDLTKRFGTYAYRVPDSNGNFGLWVGYEDPDTAANKAGYAKAKGLGGIAIFDLTYDDFHGYCSGDPFPILRAAKYRI